MSRSCATVARCGDSLQPRRGAVAATSRHRRHHCAPPLSPLRAVPPPPPPPSLCLVGVEPVVGRAQCTLGRRGVGGAPRCVNRDRCDRDPGFDSWRDRRRAPPSSCRVYVGYGTVGVLVRGRRQEAPVTRACSRPITRRSRKRDVRRRDRRRASSVCDDDDDHDVTTARRHDEDATTRAPSAHVDQASPLSDAPCRATVRAVTSRHAPRTVRGASVRAHHRTCTRVRCVDDGPQAPLLDVS